MANFGGEALSLKKQLIDPSWLMLQGSWVSSVLMGFHRILLFLGSGVGNVWAAERGCARKETVGLFQLALVPWVLRFSWFRLILVLFSCCMLAGWGIGFK